MTRRFVYLSFIGLVVLSFLHLTHAQEDKRAPIKQPIAFSHKLHAESGIQCARCHTESKDQAGIPNAKDCVACHRNFQTESATLQALSVYEKTPIPWVRVYKLPSFVFFSHKSHLQAQATCATCHGEVQQREVLWQEKEISMASCLSCHKERGASTECSLCHELNR
jgi:hypothetical protein